MNITQPEHILLLQNHHVIDKQAVLFISVGYVVEINHDLVNAQEAWPWLLPYFKNEPMDMALKKQRGTFAVAGNAYAQPQGSSTTQMAIHAQLGGLEKSLYVFGNRHWEQGLAGWKISEPQPFSVMPVDLEHAFTQSDTPVQVGTALPNIELPSQLIHTPTDSPTTATLRTLTATAPEKQRWLGQLDDVWLQQHAPWLPIDTHPRWFDDVPADQSQPAYWQGNESWSVTGMNSNIATVSGTLPALKPRLLVQKSNSSNLGSLDDSSISEAALDLDTVWLFPNEQRVLLWYRAALSVAREDAIDVAALAVFTEHHTDIPSTTEQLTAKWRELEHIEDEATETQSMPSAAPIATAALSAEAIAFQEELIADIQSRFDTESMAFKQELAKLGEQVGIHIPPPEHPNAHVANDLSLNSPLPTLDTNAFEQQLRHDIDSTLQQGKDQADQALEELAQQLQLDPQEFKQLTQAAQNTPDSTVIDLQAMLAQAPMSEELRQSILSKVKQAEQQEQRIKQQLATQMPSTLLADDGSVTDLMISNIDVKVKPLNTTDFRGAILTDCDFSQADLTEADFTGAQVTRCHFEGAQLRASNWAAADISHCDFSHAVLTAAHMPQTTFSECQFIQSQMQELDLSHSTFEQCLLNKAILCNADLTSATVLQSQFLGADLSEVQWPDARVSMQSDFSHALLNLANLQGASLQDSIFTGANFSECNLNDAFIKNSILDQSHGLFLNAKNSSFQDSSLCDIQWRGANLMQAAFIYCALTYADLRDSNLFEVDTRTTETTNTFLEGALGTERNQ